MGCSSCSNYSHCSTVWAIQLTRAKTNPLLHCSRCSTSLSLWVIRSTQVAACHTVFSLYNIWSRSWYSDCNISFFSLKVCPEVYIRKWGINASVKNFAKFCNSAFLIMPRPVSSSFCCCWDSARLLNWGVFPTMKSCGQCTCAGRLCMISPAFFKCINCV